MLTPPDVRPQSLAERGESLGGVGELHVWTPKSGFRKIFLGHRMFFFFGIFSTIYQCKTVLALGLGENCGLHSAHGKMGYCLQTPAVEERAKRQSLCSHQSGSFVPGSSQKTMFTLYTFLRNPTQSMLSLKSW